MNLFTKQKYSHRYREQTYGYQEGKSGGRLNWEIVIDIYTLLYIKKITNKDLLYSVGNASQCSITAYMGKESKKKRTYVYIQLIHFAVHLKPTQHCKSTILQ